MKFITNVEIREDFYELKYYESFFENDFLKFECNGFL